MAKRLPQDVYAQLIAAGWDPQAAVTMTAIAGAESGYDNANLGDVNLENATWGPSYGLFQIRTLKSATGTGADRDISRLASGDAEQARAAWDISRGGTDFSPWSTYTSGAYQQFLPAAQTAAKADPDPHPFPTLGPDWLPWNWPSDAGNQAAAGANQLLGGARNVGLQVLAVVGGVGLVLTGLVLLAKPAAKAYVHRAAPLVGGSQ